MEAMFGARERHRMGLYVGIALLLSGALACGSSQGGQQPPAETPPSVDPAAAEKPNAGSPSAASDAEGSNEEAGPHGGVDYTLPAWLKQSFLDFREDVVEARAQGKHVLVFFHLEHCPACARMTTEDFADASMMAVLKEHFDVIAVNIRGDVEVVWLDGQSYTERQLAGELGAYATPTLVFADLEGNPVLQLTGYRDRRAVRQALDFVRSRSYETMTLAEYQASHPTEAVYEPKPHPRLGDGKDLGGYKGPLFVLFEDRRCAECSRFHERTLNHPDVLAELKKYRFVRYDADSQESIVGPDGRRTTPKAWAEDLGLTYRPSMAFYDAGELVLKIDYLQYHYYLKETLRFVSGGYYKTLSRRQYNRERREELLRAGKEVDYRE